MRRQCLKIAKDNIKLTYKETQCFFFNKMQTGCLKNILETSNKLVHINIL